MELKEILDKNRKAWNDKDSSDMNYVKIFNLSFDACWEDWDYDTYIIASICLNNQGLSIPIDVDVTRESEISWFLDCVIQLSNPIIFHNDFNTLRLDPYAIVKDNYGDEWESHKDEANEALMDL